MYTAPNSFNEDNLDQRIPLSVAQWHEHVNLCYAARHRKQGSPASQPGIRISRIDQHPEQVPPTAATSIP